MWQHCTTLDNVWQRCTTSTTTLHNVAIHSFSCTVYNVAKRAANAVTKLHSVQGCNVLQRCNNVVLLCGKTSYRLVNRGPGWVVLDHRWIPLTKACDEEIWCFRWCAPERLSKQSRCWWFETPRRPLWHHSNEQLSLKQINLSMPSAKRQPFCPDLNIFRSLVHY